jgi:hypothetical protein
MGIHGYVKGDEFLILEDLFIGLTIWLGVNGVGFIGHEDLNWLLSFANLEQNILEISPPGERKLFGLR